MTDAEMRLREEMVTQQLIRRGIRDERVLKAMREMPRHLFVPAQYRAMAYDDTPLPIGYDQTISQPLMVGMMAEALRLQGGERVLEIGTGSGYQAAILARLALVVFTIERIPELAAQARTTLAMLGITRAHVFVGDGTAGLPEHAPYHAIVVAAGAPQVPKTLLAQLIVNGRLVIPTGDRMEQMLLRVTKTDDGFRTEHLGGCRFVPLIGEHGWPGAEREQGTEPASSEP
ncbi:MAG: protein-L-isoaspartate(D-aspartate) O-methyltransferase [Nitrospinae bacterium]|nr:protein-L-isoaspartate(D-aspartate) O-methyltransferase [Nitrospinota bacterium]